MKNKTLNKYKILNRDKKTNLVLLPANHFNLFEIVKYKTVAHCWIIPNL